MKHTYTLEQFKKEIYYLINENNGYGVHQLFDKDWIGSCPCGHGYLTIDGIKYLIDTQCWRVGDRNCTLKVSGRATKSKKEIIKLLKMALDKQDWYGEYKVI